MKTEERLQDSTVTIEVVSDSGEVVKVTGLANLHDLSFNELVWRAFTREAMFQIIKGELPL